MLSPRLTVSRLTRVLLPLLLLANIFALLHYIGIDYHFLINSDSAAKNLLAQEIVETGHYFPPEWNYVNKDLWVYFTHTLILPLLPFMRNAFAVHAIAGVITAALVIASAWAVTGMLGLSRNARLVSMLVLTGGISTNMAENIFGQGAYGTLFYMGCFLLWAYWRGVHATGRARWGWAAAVAALAILVCWSNPQRAAVYFIAPLLAAGAAMQWQDVQEAGRQGRRAPWRHAAWLALFLAGCVAGAALNVLTLRHVHTTTGLTQLAWLEYPAMIEHALGALRGLLSLFEGLPIANTPLLSPIGVFQALRLLGAVTLLALLPWALGRSMTSENKAMRFFAVFTGTVLAISLFISITTGVVDMRAPESSMRYLSPSLLCALFLLIGLLAQPRTAGPLRRLTGAYAVLLLVLSAPYAYSTFYFVGYFPSKDQKAATAEGRAMDFLQQRGLGYGYSSFWNAGRITVLSGQKIRNRQINIVDGLPVPMRHLSSNRWYWPEAWSGQTFLMLTEQEADALDREKLYALTGQPLEVVKHHEWRIWIFDHNIARDLAWDQRYLQPANIALGETTPHQIGRIESGKLVAAPGEQGPLMYGPWINAERGSYEVRFDIETKGASNDFGRLDVVSDQGRALHAEKALAGQGRREVRLAFSSSTPLNQLEFRAISNGTGQVTIHGVRLQRAVDSKE
jgi:hypothetical protein